MTALMHTEFLVHHCFLAKTVANMCAGVCCLVMHMQATLQAVWQLSQSLQPNAQQPAKRPHTWSARLVTAQPKANKAGRYLHAEQSMKCPGQAAGVHVQH